MGIPYILTDIINDEANRTLQALVLWMSLGCLLLVGIAVTVALVISFIDSTVTVTEDGKRKAQESITLSRETAEVFSKVTEAINDVILAHQKVSLNAINEVVLNSRQISLTTK